MTPMIVGDTIASITATAPQTILTAMTRLRDECFVNFTPDVITVAAAAFEVDESVIRMQNLAIFL